MKSLLAVFVCLVLVACAAGEMQDSRQVGSNFRPHYEHSLFQVTDQGLYIVEMMIRGGSLTVGNNDFDLIVHRDVEGNRDVEGAKISIEFWMPEHGHGIKPVPEIIERGGGLYSVKGLQLTMEGLWEMRISVRADGMDDTTVFTFADVKAPHDAAGAKIHMGDEHQGSHMMGGMRDFSTVRTSNEGIFNVTFASLDTPIPLNTIHSWELTVKDKKGGPVERARITVEGSMPNHSHGMPTRPLVTREIRKGVYLVEGMKFQMPGWWAVTFTIESGTTHDAVTFNLKL